MRNATAAPLAVQLDGCNYSAVPRFPSFCRIQFPEGEGGALGRRSGHQMSVAILTKREEYEIHCVPRKPKFLAFPPLIEEAQKV